MGDSKIEWTDATWNPVAGCTWASPGCDNCYAALMTRRLEAMGQTDYAGLTTKKHFNGVVRTHSHKLDAPLHWRKPRMVFVNSMSDLFHKDVPTEFIWEVFSIMRQASQHTFQVLTKRPERMAGVVSEMLAASSCDPSPNVWLGTSIENMEQCDRLNHLTKCPAAVRFVSFEPLLEYVDPGFRNWADEPKRRIHWAIIGGESGPRARPCNVDWVRFLINDCRDGGVAPFVKQLGAKVYDETNVPAANVLFPNGVPANVVCEGWMQRRADLSLQHSKGGDWDEWPSELRVREFPVSN